MFRTKEKEPHLLILKCPSEKQAIGESSLGSTTLGTYPSYLANSRGHFGTPLEICWSLGVSLTESPVYLCSNSSCPSQPEWENSIHTHIAAATLPQQVGHILGPHAGHIWEVPWFPERL